MGRAENDHTRVNFHALKYGAIPLGEWVFPRIMRLGEDERTMRAIALVRVSLENRGLMILDAHRTFGDIIATGTVFSKHVKLNGCVAAVSAYDYQFRFLRRRFFFELGSLPGVELYPVYRDDDQNDPKRRRLYEEARANNTLEIANRRYFRRSIEAINSPHNILLVAAYNGVGRMEKNGLSRGASDLLAHGATAICSLTKWNWWERTYRVYLSDRLLTFERGTDSTSMHQTVLAEHRTLLTRAMSQEPS